MPRIAIEDGQVELRMHLNARPPDALVYFVEYSDTLAAGDWQLAPAVVWETSGPVIDGRVPTVVRVPDAPNAMPRFYRINVRHR